MSCVGGIGSFYLILVALLPGIMVTYGVKSALLQSSYVYVISSPFLILRLYFILWIAIISGTSGVVCRKISFRDYCLALFWNH